MRILLVNMPWALIDIPSLALGILRRATREAVPGAEVEVLHANLEYVRTGSPSGSTSATRTTRSTRCQATSSE